MRILDKATVALHACRSSAWPRTPSRRSIDIIKRPHGILLVTGPTGSGKTTTLYAALQDDRQPGDQGPDGRGPGGVPPGRGQPDPGAAEDRPDVRPRACGRILRHDPDVVMIGEIRDLETAEAAIQASLTGHLVLSTLHTNDACSAATRLLDMGVEPFLVTSTLEAAMAQRLVRTICPECKEDVRARPEPAAGRLQVWRPGQTAVPRRAAAASAAARASAAGRASSN